MYLWPNLRQWQIDLIYLSNVKIKFTNIEKLPL